MGERRDIYRVLTRRPEGRPRGRPKRRWEDNIKMDLQKLRWGKDWIELTQNSDRWHALENVLMNPQIL